MINALPSYRLIETPRDLEDLGLRLNQETSVALDLEGDSLYHYREKICLIQIAAGNDFFLIDPLKITDLSPLALFLTNPGIRKILHGADYDIRSLYRDYQFEVHNLFDTESAARFLGLKETGLGSLLDARFQIRLDKRFQKTDWSKRPLSDPMLAYAAADVAYLIPLAQSLMTDLEDLGRLPWVLEEGDRLCRVRFNPPYQGPLFLQFKGGRRLDSRSLGLLENLLQFRKAQAEKRDRPLFKILGADVLKTLALEKPLTLDQLKGIKGLSARLIDRLGEELIECLKQGLAIPETDLPRFPPSIRPQVIPAVAARVKTLKEWREKKARELNLDPGVVISNSLIDQIGEKHPTGPEDLELIPELRQWQKQSFGPEILQVLCSPPNKSNLKEQIRPENP
jgi:ribonuclease D